MQKDILIARLANAVDKIFVHMQSPDFKGDFADHSQTILNRQESSAYLVPAAIINEISSIMAGDAGPEDYLTGDWKDG